MAFGTPRTFASPVESVPSLATRLLREIWRIADVTRYACNAMLQEELEHTLPHHLVLHALANAGEPLSVTELARALRCSKANASALIARVELRRHVSAMRDLPDARVVTLRFTPHGHDAARDGALQIASDAALLLAVLEPGEQDTLVTLLRKITFPSALSERTASAAWFRTRRKRPWRARRRPSLRPARARCPLLP